MSEQSKAITKRTPPPIITVGKHKVIATMRWNDITIADHIVANSQRWIEVSELAKIAYGHNNKETKSKARRYLHKIKVHLIDRGLLLATEKVDHGRVKAVKIYDGSVEADRQYIQEDLERMRKRGELTTERYERAMMLLGIPEQ